MDQSLTGRRLSGASLYHLAEGLRGVLVGDAAALHLLAVIGLSALMLAVLVPLDLRLLRRRVLGE